MGIGEAIGLGILQGVAEFLPISSSGHLSLMQYFLGLGDTPKFFDVMLHVGTLVAVLSYYGRALWDGSRLGPEGRNLLTPRMVGLVVLATLPAVAAGAFFRPTKLSPGQSLESVPRSWRQRVADLREYSGQRPWVVLGFLTATGGVLLAGARGRGGTVDSATMRWPHALAIGIAQAFSAIFPGLSRSGMTISTGMLAGLRGEWAVHFSLLLSIPAVLGAVVLKGRDVDPAWLRANIAPTLVGTLVSAVVGWYSIQLLVGSVRRGRWWWFTIYLWCLVAVIGMVLLAGKEQALTVLSP